MENDELRTEDEESSTEDDEELSVDDPSGYFWSKFNHYLDVSKEHLLKLESQTKLKVLKQFMSNDKFDDVDLYNLTVFELQDSTNKAHDHTNRGCGISVDRESSKNHVVASCSDANDGERFQSEESLKKKSCEKSSVTVPKGKRSVREHIIKPCKKSSFTIPVDHTFKAEVPKAEKHITIRFKLKPPENSSVSEPATCSIDRDDGDEIRKPITEECNMVQKFEKVGSKLARSDTDYEDEERDRTKKRMNKMVEVVVLDPQPPELPAKLKELYKAQNVSEAVLVIQKTLYSTDVSSGHGRLSMPLSQIDNNGFLSKEEKELLSSRTRKETPQIPVKLIEAADEDCRVYNINLRQWNMKKSSGKINSVYNLVTGWNEFVKNNKLCEGMTVQLWAFRIDSELWFSLVKSEMIDEMN